MFGTFFVQYLARQGWTSMLASMGNSLKEFLANLNEIHSVLERDFRSSIFPFFSAYEDDNGCYCLTYSSRRFLPALVCGILKELALVLFNSSLELDELHRDSSKITWRASETNATGKSCETVPPMASDSDQHFGFFQLHQALVSMWRVPDCAWSQSCHSAEEQQEILMLPAIDGQVDSEVLSAGRSKMLAASPSHSTAAHDFNDNENVQAHESGPDDPLASVAGIREEFSIEPSVSLESWLSEQGTETRLDLAWELCRAVPAASVACQWYELGGLEAMQTKFWTPENKSGSYYAWSEGIANAGTSFDDGSSPPFHFVSHSWLPPQDWHSVMGDKCSYADIKAAELCIVAKDLCAESLQDASRWEEAKFWIDKCCIRQGDQELMSLSIQLIEEFIQLCDGMIVLLSWSYFSRLWCVYEWACCLVFHEPENLLICAESFYRETTEDKFLHAIRYFSVDACQCSDQRDRCVLEQKIHDYYGSRNNFERFLQISVIAITARSLAARGARCKLGLSKWVQLADDLGFHELAEALRVADPVAWRRHALEGKVDSLTQDVQTLIKAQSDAWFAQRVAPILTMERARAVQQSVRKSMNLRKNSVRQARTEGHTHRHKQARENSFFRQISAPAAMETLTAARCTICSGKTWFRGRSCFFCHGVVEGRMVRMPSEAIKKLRAGV
eukprot:TRINITY_DN3759_c0_g1_i2.p1 TRINITY_DN3759_c0_g1~~TRINITY_DN3759_c0_g1_i2.p1  ORF type:complete len:674 (+),score=92.77 TRINITY_DN3759_c0_g1_i2:329-2350(+)